MWRVQIWHVLHIIGNISHLSSTSSTSSSSSSHHYYSRWCWGRRASCSCWLCVKHQHRRICLLSCHRSILHIRQHSHAISLVATSGIPTKDTRTPARITRTAWHTRCCGFWRSRNGASLGLNWSQFAGSHIAGSTHFASSRGTRCSQPNRMHNLLNEMNLTTCNLTHDASTFLCWASRWICAGWDVFRTCRLSYLLSLASQFIDLAAVVVVATP